MHCPNCRGAMAPLKLVNHTGTPLEIDVCWPCHMIWFDGYESMALSPNSVVELFRKIHEAQKNNESGARNLISKKLSCGVCSGKLEHTHDLQLHGRFAYHRCGHGHGRASTFTQFLQEKNFVRSLKPWEVRTLSAKVKQIRCSSCGGPIDLEKDTACSHCGSAISVLDHDAVEKALLNYQRTAQQPDFSRNPTGYSLPGESQTGSRTASTPRPTPPSHIEDYVNSRSANDGVLRDLVEVGIGVLIASIFS